MQDAFRGTASFMIFDRSGQVVGMNAAPLRAQALEEFIARKKRAG